MAQSLGYDRFGVGPPLVLLHPLGADRHVWDEVGNALSTEREVIAVDLPGFGESAPLGEAPTPAALAAAVAAFLTDLEIHSPDIAGNSLGGWVALELGLSANVNSVTAIAPAGLWPRPLGPKPSFARSLSRLGRPLIGTVTASATGRRLLLAGSVARPELVSAGAAAHLIRAYATAPDFARVNALMRSGRFDQLDAIAVPVTLAWPEHDTLIARPRRLPPQIRNVDLPGTGHIPMLDQPLLVAEMLRESIEVAAAAKATDERRNAGRRAER